MEVKGANTVIFLKPSVNLPPLNKNAADTNRDLCVCVCSYVYVPLCMSVCMYVCVSARVCVPVSPCVLRLLQRHHVVKQDPAQVSAETAEGVKALVLLRLHGT